MVNVLHISPTFYSDHSVIGGGEKYVVYVARSLKKVAESRGIQFSTAMIAFGDINGVHHLADNIDLHVLQGRPWDVTSLDAAMISSIMNDFDVILVHQCLCGFGLFLASHARLLGKFVIGLDHGGGEHPLVARSAEIGRIFNLFQAYSQFGADAFAEIEGEVMVARGPVDTDYYCPAKVKRDDRHVIALGRYLPHKGFDRIIKCLPTNLQLTIVGRRYDDDYFDHLVSLSKGKSVRFLEGADDDEVRRLLRSAGIFVHASTHIDYRGKYYAKPELLGLAPLEALACGTPTLVSSAGSLPELAVINGCEVFNDDDELTQQLWSHVDGQMFWQTPEEIHADVNQKFGMNQYGAQLLDHVCQSR